MTREEVTTKVKELIAKTTNLDPANIADDASFADDLGIDSLAMLEIGIDVDYTFKLGLPEEQMAEIKNVKDSVDLVLETLAAKEASA